MNARVCVSNFPPPGGCPFLIVLIDPSSSICSTPNRAFIFVPPSSSVIRASGSSRCHFSHSHFGPPCTHPTAIVGSFFRPCMLACTSGKRAARFSHWVHHLANMAGFHLCR